MANWDYVRELGLTISGSDDKGVALWHLAHTNPDNHAEFIVEVVADKGDKGEEWIDRAEALRHFRDVDFAEPQQNDLCKAIAEILRDVDEDLTLRQWAAFYVGKCLNCTEVIEAAVKFCLIDDDLFWNVIESLEEEVNIPPSAQETFFLKAKELTDIRLKNALLNALGSSSA